MRDVNWNEIQELQDGDSAFEQLPPGGYIVKITRVEDQEDKEGLLIEFDIARGDFTGYAQATYDRAGFWPLKTWCSYKTKALRFFKGFKTAVEVSNPKYHFDTRNVQGLVGRYFGVVLGEEEYLKNNGEVGVRLYTAFKRSAQAINEGNFTVPELKPFRGSLPSAQTPPAASGFASFADNTGLDDGELPF